MRRAPRVILNQRYFNYGSSTTEQLIEVRGKDVLTDTRKVSLEYFIRYYELLGKNRTVQYTYPDCNCPFDMGADNKCLRGFENKKGMR